MKRRKTTKKKNCVAKKKNKKRRLCICACIKQGKPQGEKREQYELYVQPKNIQYVHTAQNKREGKKKQVKCWGYRVGKTGGRSCKMFSSVSAFFAGETAQVERATFTECNFVQSVLSRHYTTTTQISHNTRTMYIWSRIILYAMAFFFLLGGGKRQYSHAWTFCCWYHTALTESLFLETAPKHVF